MCDHPSSRSKAGNAHVETSDGHFDKPSCDNEHHQIERAELIDSESAACMFRFTSPQSAYHFEDVILMVRHIIRVFPSPSNLDDHNLEHGPGDGEKL